MTKRISCHIQNQPLTNSQRQGLLLQLLFISALNQILVSISCLLYAFVKRWDKELRVCFTTSSVSSGWGSHPVAFGVWYATNLEPRIRAVGIFFTSLPKNISSRHGRQKYSKMGSHAQKELSFCCRALSQSSMLKEYGRGGGIHRWWKECSVSTLLSSCSAHKFHIWDTDLMIIQNPCWFHSPDMDKSPWIKTKSWVSM